MKAIAFQLGLIIFLGGLVPAYAVERGNRLTYLDEFCDPFYVDGDFPKLTTPQWVDDEGVDAVVVLSIDDMRGHEKWETYLRPIIDRLKKIDGRAPVSIMTCRVTPDNPHLQTWLREGLSLEVHTIDHPCPCLQGNDFDQAAATYHNCVDLLSQVPNSRPVAFRMPCCDSRNTTSPRFWTEIFNKTSPKGNFLSIDSSVFNIITPADKSLPRELVLGDDGKSRFRRYVPFKSFVNTIEDYPYPYVIGRMCWQFPCVVPSDWSAQHVQRPNNPDTVRDLKLALDAAVLKQGVFTLVFHPHGWIRADQIVQLIDHAQNKYGRRVKFLNFRECAERMEKSLLAGHSLRDSQGRDNGVRILDVDNDGYVDVVIGNEQLRTTRIWSPQDKSWREVEFPVSITSNRSNATKDGGVRFGVLRRTGAATILVNTPEQSGGWHYGKQGWSKDERLTRGLEILGRTVFTSKNGVDQGVRLRDLDGDGTCELIAGGPDWQGVFQWDEAAGSWNTLPFSLPANTFVADRQGRDAGLRFVDVDQDGRGDVVFSNSNRWSAHLFRSLENGWSHGIAAARADDGLVPPFVRDGSNYGAWFHSNHAWLQNENTHRLPDGVARVSFAQLREAIREARRPSDSASASDLPAPRSPEKSLASIRTKPDLTVELVASEPHVVDPVAFDWGPDGRLWVVEMRDYPLGLDGKGKPGGRVKVLTDTNGDGRYDKSSVFLDGLPYPTAVKVWRDGVIITAAPRIIFARDTDLDNRADEVRTLYQGFGEGNQQHRVNGLRWGLDNWLYVGNGDSGGVVRSLATGDEVNVRRRDLRIQPDSGRLQAVSGNTQFGINRDDWGNWFGGNNSHPAWHYTLKDRYLRRNPHFAPPAVKREISASPGPSRVFPLSRTLERFNNPQSANHFTSACSPMIYRDRLLGEAYYGNVFVCEPVHNLVHREIVATHGSTFTSRRADDEQNTEFLASSDSWFRPAMIRTGPDGALWIADMYRLVIEHPEWIPQHFQKRYDLRAGEDRGRIYRIVPKGTSPSVPNLQSRTAKELVSTLNDGNGTLRDLAQQMILWKDDASTVGELQSSVTDGPDARGRLHALCTLDGLEKLQVETLLNALRDKHPAVRRHAIRISERFVDDPPSLLAELVRLGDDADIQVRIQLAYSCGNWKDYPASGRTLARILKSSDDAYLRAAGMSSLTEKNVGEVLVHLANSNVGSDEELFGDVLTQAVAFTGGRAVPSALKRVTTAKETGQFEDWQLRVAETLLARLLARGENAELRNALESDLSPMFAFAVDTIGRNDASDATRGKAMQLLRWAPRDAQPKTADLLPLLETTQPPAIQVAAFKLLAAQALSNEEPAILRPVLSGWARFTPSVRREMLNEWLSRPAHTRWLLDEMESGRLPASRFRAAQRRQLLEHGEEDIQRRAKRLFGKASASTRQAVLDQYASALDLAGDAEQGRATFAKHCAACHRVRGVGHSVGPNLEALKNRAPESLLTAILDPNRAVEDKFLSYAAITVDGRVISGMLESEAGASLTLRTANGKSIVLLRNRLEEFRSSNKSFMPEGLELDLKPGQIADVIAFLRTLGSPPKEFAGNQPGPVRPNESGVILLPATAARIYGSRIVFEQQYKNLGWWSAEDDRAEWTITGAKPGDYQVELEFACHQDAAGNSFQLRTGATQLTGKVESTETWDDYQWKPIGQVELKLGEQDVVFSSLGPIRGHLIDLRAIRLTPVKP